MTAKHVSDKELRAKAEARAKKITHSPDDVSLEKTRTLLHELEVHQIELEMQNQELRETQHRLEEARDEYTDLFDFAPVGYILLDEKGIIKNINLTGSDLLGVERLHIKGRPFSTYMPRTESATLFLKLREAFATGTLSSFELQLRRSSDTLFTALLQGTVSEDKKQGGAICRITLQDVTELRKTEDLQQQHNELQKEQTRIQKYNEELEGIVMERTKELSDALNTEKQINEMKSAFITIASHELRTPITIIMSSIILLEKFKNLGQHDKMDRHIVRIKSSVKHFTNILEDFLSLEKLERGAVRVHKEKLDLPGFVNEVMQEMEGMLKLGQHINYSHTGNTEVVEDKKILRNIILNLLSNAIKYSEADIELYTKIETDQMTLSVVDTGIGIPEEEQKHLFERFFRAQNVKDFQGTGLGLSIVERYLELLGGTIGFTSQPDLGSTFTITIQEKDKITF